MNKSSPSTTETMEHEIADAMPLIVWTHDENGTPTYFNRRWTEYTGCSLEETLRAGTLTFVHADDQKSVGEPFARARPTGEAFTVSYRLRARDGSYRWHEARVAPLRGADGSVRRWVGTATDVEDQRIALEEQRYLAQATMLLGSSLDLERTLADVARLVVPTLADWCSIDLLRADGELERAAVQHVDPSKVKLAWDLWKLTPPRPSDEHGVFAIIRSRTSQLLQISDEMLVALIADPVVLELCRSLGLRSSICVPLVARDRALGALTLVTAESNKPYAARDLAFAEEMAHRISIAIDNARLYEEATRARSAAEIMATDILEQSKAMTAELLKMRAERDAARAELERARSASSRSGST